MKIIRSLLSLSALLALAPISLTAQDDVPAAPTEEAAPAKEEKPAAAAEKQKPKKERKPWAPEITSSKPGAEKVRLFILSGQSNMAGLKPADSFTPAVEAAFPDDDVVVVKDAQSGQPIRKWLADWEPAEGSDAPVNYKQGRGQLYERLKSSITTAMEGKSKPVSVTFVWMQGEADTNFPWSAQVYEESLKELIALVRKDMDAPETVVVIGRISDFTDAKRRPEDWKQVKDAQVAVAEADPLVAWVDTDDLNGDSNGLHYNRPGYTTMGQRFADEAIKLLKGKE